MNDLTYTERADVADKRADRGRIERIAQAYREFQTCGKRIGSGIVDSVNLAREIGLELQGIVGAEQMGFGFYTSHCAKDLPFGFDAVKQFISIARKMIAPAKTVEDVTPVMQQVFFAAELLKLPEPHEGQQQSHAEPPVPFAFNMFGKAWIELEKRVVIEELDDQSREGMRGVLDTVIKKATEWREKL